MFHSIASIQLSSLIKEEHCYSLPGFHKIFLMSFFFSAVIEPVNKISFFFFFLCFSKEQVSGKKRNPNVPCSLAIPTALQESPLTLSHIPILDIDRDFKSAYKSVYK